LVPERKGPFAFGRVEMVLMFQHEVAQRIVAVTGKSPYSRLSVMTQQHCDSKILFTLPGDVFVPKPDVQCTLVSIVPRVEPRGEAPFSALEKVCATVFGKSRKMLSNSIKNLHPLGLELLTKFNIEPSRRPATLSVQEFCMLAREYEILKKNEKK